MENSESISIVVPVFNEASNLRPLHEALTRQLGEIAIPYEILFIDDGSQDGSLEALRQLSGKDLHVRTASLSRNFGHQYAITAGMEYARGDAVVVMDADLQHPPELIPKMVEAWRKGVQVVYTVREDDEKTSWFKRWTSSAFYKLMNCMSDTPIVPGAADFRLLDRAVVNALIAMPERSRFLRGMVSWLGFRQQSLSYRANPRFSGKSKYSFRRMLTLALQGITSFSSVPLHISAYVGLFAALVGLPYAIWALYAKCFTDITVPGWTSLLIAVLFLGGVQLMSIGVIGEYVGRIYTEVKRRPLYLTKELIGFEQAGALPEPQSSAILRFHSPHSEPGARLARTLIVNADDLGICPSTDLAIAQAARDGIVTSASLMANMEAVEQVCNLSANSPGSNSLRRMGLGVHFCLSSGRPLLAPREVPLLVDNDGYFHRGFAGLFRLLRSRRANEAAEQIEREFAAQIERIESLGIELDHVDSHQHVHMIPQIFRIAAAHAAARGIAIRVADERILSPGREIVGNGHPKRPREIQFSRRLASGGLLKKFLLSCCARWIRRSGDLPENTAHYFGVLDTGRISLPVLRWIVRSLPEGISEINLHPGSGQSAPVGSGLEQRGSTCSRADQRFWSRPERAAELAAVLDPSLPDELRSLGIKLACFRDAWELNRDGIRK